MSAIIAKPSKKIVGKDDKNLPVYEDNPEVIGLTLPRDKKERKIFLDGAPVPTNNQERSKWVNTPSLQGSFPLDIHMPCYNWCVITTRDNAMNISSDIPCTCGSKNHYFVKLKAGEKVAKETKV